MRTLLSLCVSMTLSAALAGCTATTAPESTPVTLPSATATPLSVSFEKTGEGRVWSVGIYKPTGFDSSDCVNDPAIASGLMSADMPTSHVNFELTPEASETDARRIAECFSSTLTGGAITVTPPA